MMQQVTLEPKTHTGKNKLSKTADASINWDGNWNVIDERDRVLFSPKPGPWLLLTPAKEDGIIAERLSRWVHATDDANFTVRSKPEFSGWRHYRQSAGTTGYATTAKESR